MLKRRCPGDILYAEELIARSWAAGPTNQPMETKCRIYTPTPRLSCSISIGFEPDTPRVITTYDNIDPVGGDTESYVRFSGFQRNSTGKLAKSFTFPPPTIDALPLPISRELDTNYPLMEVDAFLSIPGGTLKVLGNWILTVEWEPSVCIPPNELCELFNMCDVGVQWMPTTLGGVPLANQSPFVLYYAGS